MVDSRLDYWTKLYFALMRRNSYRSANSKGATYSPIDASIDSALSMSGESLNNYYADKMASAANKTTGGVPTSTIILNPKDAAAPTAGSTTSGGTIVKIDKDRSIGAKDSISGGGGGGAAVGDGPSHSTTTNLGGLQGSGPGGSHLIPI